MNVYKFGGSSLSNAARISSVAEIVRDITSGIIVLSAMGKTTLTDEKITDLLIKLCKNKNHSSRIVKKIKDKFINAAKGLQAPACFYTELYDFFDKISISDDSYVISRGEYFTAKLFSYFTQIPFVDSANIIKFDKNRTYSHCLTQKAISAVNSDLIITCGFYGCDPEGNIVLFPRGGGDTAAACLAKAIDADYLYDYTDIGGLKNIPPNLTKKGITISDISIKDLDYLARNGTELFAKEGTKYLHGKTFLIILNSLKRDGKTIARKNVFGRKNSLFTTKNDLVFLIFTIHNRFKYFQILYGIVNFFMSRKIIFIDFFKNKNDIYLTLRKSDYIKLPKDQLKDFRAIEVTALHFLFSDNNKLAEKEKALTEKIKSITNNYFIRSNKQMNIAIAYIDDKALNKEKIKRLAEDFTDISSQLTN